MAESPLSNAGKVEKALGELRKLPLLPATAQQAMALANDDASTLQQFSHLVEKDLTLATSILKLANSPIFSWGRTIDSLGQAVVRLGLRECQNLMVAVSMGNLFHHSDPKTKGFCAVLWKHCFLTGCLARRLNQELHFGYQGEEFTAGLLHDLGRILLAVTLPVQFAQADPLDFVEGPHVLERERGILQTDHCQLGATYAEQNRLPASAIAAIHYHHHPEQSRDHRGILGIVASADDMANHLQRSGAPEGYDLDANLGFQFLANGWTAEKIAEFKRVVPKLLQETVKAASEQGNSAPKSAALQPTMSAPKPRTPPPTAPAAEPTTSFWDNVKSWLG
jgi:HD-like signal output (HDOD) protein